MDERPASANGPASEAIATTGLFLNIASVIAIAVSLASWGAANAGLATSPGASPRYSRLLANSTASACRPTTASPSNSPDLRRVSDVARDVDAVLGDLAVERRPAHAELAGGLGHRQPGRRRAPG